MKSLISVLVAVLVMGAYCGETGIWHDANGLKWYYSVDADQVTVGINVSGMAAIPKTTVGALEVPSLIAGYPVVKIGTGAFAGCTGLTSVVIPFGVEEIGQSAFSGCEGLTSATIPTSVKYIDGYAFNGCHALSSVVIPSSVLRIGNYAFYECSELCFAQISQGVTTIGACAFYGCSKLIAAVIPSSATVVDSSAFGKCNGLRTVTIPACVTKLSTWFRDSYTSIQNVTIAPGVVNIPASAFSGATGLQVVEIPASVTSIGNSAFSGCSSLMSVVMHGDAPDLGSGVFYGTPKRLVISVPCNSIGWGENLSKELPETWGERAIVHAGENYNWSGGPGSLQTIAMTITNIVVSYVLNSVQPEFAVPTVLNSGFVNVITEIKGGCVAVPAAWTENYPTFSSCYGTDLTKALIKKNGKKDAAGNDMFVWQDYVAGTDPTNPNDRFCATISVVDGKVIVSYSPELDVQRKSLRQYTVWGKSKLTDQEWHVVDDEDIGQFNFFKVTVEMRP